MAPLSKRSYSVVESLPEPLPESEQNRSTFESEEIKESLTVMIRSNLAKLNTNDIQSIQIRLIVAEQMARICELYNEENKKSMAEFYNYLKQTLDISQSSYCHYQQYYQFLVDFPRFKKTPITYKELLKSIGKIRKWFESDECSEFSEVNFCSRRFWEETNILEKHHGQNKTLSSDMILDSDETRSSVSSDITDQTEENLPLSLEFEATAPNRKTIVEFFRFQKNFYIQYLYVKRN